MGHHGFLFLPERAVIYMCLNKIMLKKIYWFSWLIFGWNAGSATWQQTLYFSCCNITIRNFAITWQLLGLSLIISFSVFQLENKTKVWFALQSPSKQTVQTTVRVVMNPQTVGISITTPLQPSSAGQKMSPWQFTLLPQSTCTFSCNIFSLILCPAAKPMKWVTWRHEWIIFIAHLEEEEHLCISDIHDIPKNRTSRRQFVKKKITLKKCL